MVGGNKCVNCKVNQCDPKDQPATAYPLKEWCGDCIRKLKSTSKGTKCDICHQAISEDAFINLEEVEPKLAPYDKDKDWLIHPSCFTTADNDKYKDYQLGKCYEVVVIYGWKKQDPTTEKCADCQQEKQNLVSIAENGKVIKICSECKQRREGDNNDKKCEICNSSAEVEKHVAPSKIKKNSFFDKIVNEENRKECYLCKNCRDTGKGNEPLKDEPTTEKCIDCQTEKKNEELLTIQEQGKEIKVCGDCKQKRDNKPTELKNCSKCGKVMPPMITEEMKKNKMCSDCLEAERNEPTNPPLNEAEMKKKYGEDYFELKPQQQEDRKKVASNWDKNKKKPAYWRSKHCNYCDLGFKWDKNSEYLDAEEKCKRELDNHKTSCPLKNDKTTQEKKKQAEWDKDRKSTVRVFFTCKKCKGKISYDKSIAEYKVARKQTLSDLSHHEKKECGIKDKKDWIIAVSYSPSQGGNKHAPIDNSLNEDDFIFEKDNEGEVYREQSSNNKNQGLSSGMIALLIISGIAIVGIIITLLVRNKKKNKN